MNSLKVPEHGLLLAGPSGADVVPPPQAFVLSLNDDVVQQMMHSSRAGHDLALHFGKNPTLQYGSTTHRIQRPDEDAAFDLYLTKPFESTRKAERLPHAGSVFTKPQLPRSSAKKTAAAPTDTNIKKKSSAASKSSTSSGLDSDLEALQNGLAAHDAKRDRALVVEKLPTGKGTNKLLSNYSSTPKSLPASPALKAARSPNSTPHLTATEQVMERKKEQRFTLVHELAVDDRVTEFLRAKWTGKETDFQPTLEKMANYDSVSRKWSMKQPCWKELDVWKYHYDTQTDRQKAIDRAVRQFDKQRLSSSESYWQLLLPKDERNKGKCLSRLQATIAKGPARAAPKIKVQRAEDSSGSRDTADSPGSEKSKAGGESMSRSNSSSLSAKPKKSAESGSLDKKASGTIKSKTTAAATIKASPKKPKTAPATSKSDRPKVLSAAYIENSDSSGDEASKAKPQSAPPKVRDTVIVNTRHSAPTRESVRQPPMKRPRDDSDSSSSSGTPLSKRLKTKQPLQAPRSLKQATKSGQQSQTRAVPPSYRSKHASNTSPTKSSPLASSPPTNASDLDEDTPPATKKRKAEPEAKPAAIKRRAVHSVPDDVLNKAQRFKTVYQKYEALHYEITALDNPPQDKVADLRTMRVGLERLKKEIYKQYSPSRD